MWRLPYKLYYPIIIWVGHFCVRVCVSEMGEMRKRWESVRKCEKEWERVRKGEGNGEWHNMQQILLYWPYLSICLNEYTLK